MKGQNQFNSWLKYSAYAFQLMVMTGAAVFGGIKLDEKLKVSPLFTIALPLLVLSATFYKLIKDTTKNKHDGKK